MARNSEGDMPPLRGLRAISPPNPPPTRSPQPTTTHTHQQAGAIPLPYIYIEQRRRLCIIIIAPIWPSCASTMAPSPPLMDPPKIPPPWSTEKSLRNTEALQRTATKHWFVSHASIDITGVSAASCGLNLSQHCDSLAVGFLWSVHSLGNALRNAEASQRTDTETLVCFECQY
eukprot:COSAG02_NODE_11502_length_1711_cov_4.795285_2_plen_173_part_00